MGQQEEKKTGAVNYLTVISKIILVSLGCPGGLIWIAVFETNFGGSSGELSFLYRC